MSIDLRPTADSPDDDPHLWLEDIHSIRSLEWVEAQNAATLARLAGPAFERDRDALAAILDSDAKLPFVGRRGSKMYNFWKDATNVHGLWRRTTLDSYQTDSPEWEIVLDIDALRDAEEEDWVYNGSSFIEDGSGLCILRLSRGGGDAVVLREFDAETKTFVEGGFELKEAKGNAHWIDRDTLLVSSTIGENADTQSGYARIVRRWKRGTPFETAEVLFQTKPEHMAVWGQTDHTVDPPRLWVLEQLDFQNVRYWIAGAGGRFAALDLPTGMTIDACGDRIALSNRDEWIIDEECHPAGSVLVGSLDSLMQGERRFERVFTPAPRRARRYMFWNGDALVIAVLDDLENIIEIHGEEDDGWSCRHLVGIPRMGSVVVSRLDLFDTSPETHLVINCETPLTAPQLMLSNGEEQPVALKRSSSFFDATGLVTTRHEAIAEDGTAIPYFQTGPEEADGNAPVHMYGYGGFEISELPTYRASLGKAWLEQGGTSVVACIRGGGEFGPDWHKAGIREHKRTSHDDFAAVAAHLVARGVTVPTRIAAEGGSNGGILITNMLTRYPERFGALFCTIPLIDMRRYSKLLAGASWIAEYGDPDVPEDWAFLKEISAYHTAKPGQNYLPIMLATTRLDDRVHPGHARKMAAKLQSMGYDAAYYEAASGGHSYGKDSKEQATFTALGFTFLKENIGWKK